MSEATITPNTSRRALLAGGAALPGIAPTDPIAALPPEAALVVTPPMGGACFELDRQAAKRIRRYQTLDLERSGLDSIGFAEATASMNELHAEIEALQESILRTRAVSGRDVLAKLIAANVSVGRAKDDETDLVSCEKAEDAMRDCIVTMAALTGTSLIDLAAEWSDALLRVQLAPELQRVLPEIYEA